MESLVNLAISKNEVRVRQAKDIVYIEIYLETSFFLNKFKYWYSWRRYKC